MFCYAKRCLFTVKSQHRRQQALLGELFNILIPCLHIWVCVRKGGGGGGGGRRGEGGREIDIRVLHYEQVINHLFPIFISSKWRRQGGGVKEGENYLK